MRYLVVGCNHRSANVAFRERLAFSSESLPSVLREIHAQPTIHEALILSTCNRVEVYAITNKLGHASRDIRQFLSRHSGIVLSDLEPVLYQYEDAQALKHIFRVASSMDAMVVGEAQIGGQVKDAYAIAAKTRAIGPLLSRGMHRAFSTAKRIRQETEIARHPVSVSSVAADLAAHVFGDLSLTIVLVIGAGEMAELAVKHLISDGAKEVRITNRTPERAVQLARSMEAQAFPFEELEKQLHLADIVLTSTGSPKPIIHRSLLAEVMRARKQRPLFFIDIAVPRDVEREVGDLDNVYLFDMDDLEQVAAKNLRERRKELKQGECIIEQEVQVFEDWLRKQDAVPVIKQLRRHFSEVVRAETSHLAQILHCSNGHTTFQQRQDLLENMAHSIVSKLLHEPSMVLKKHAQSPDGTFLAKAVRQLFQLPEPSEIPEETRETAASDIDELPVEVEQLE